MNILQDIEEQFASFKFLFDAIRIIDPKDCSIIKTSDCRFSNFHCLEDESIRCKNCLALKAHKEQRSFQKLEMTNKKAFLIFLFPVKIQEKSYIVEFFKDVTETFVISESTEKKSLDLFFKDVTENLTKDHLTGAYNRCFLKENLLKKLNEKSANPVSIIMIDLDHFKNINDKYGHLFGDKILVEFSNIVLSLVSETDWFCRYGGEEFLIILNNKPMSSALLLSKKIREALNRKFFRFKDDIIQIYCSMGIFSSTYDKTSFSELLSKSDENLYIAKKSGRNKIVY